MSESQPTSGAVPIPSGSRESQFPQPQLPRNQEHLGPYFGDFLTLLRTSLASGGSEFGLGMSLFSLAVSINAATIIEIGRFKGFSTLALASALRLLDSGWDEPGQHCQRPGINYAAFCAPRERKLYSVDPHPTPEAADLIRTAGLEKYVQYIDQFSGQVNFNGLVDLMFIDGDHSYEGCRSDVERLVPRNLRPGGYFIIHDYFGWYDAAGKNRSPIKRVADELVANNKLQHLLIDTGYMSFMIFRKLNPALDQPFNSLP